MNTVDDELVKELEDKAADIRKRIIQIGVACGDGHFGGALSMTDIAVALYYHVMNYDPGNPGWRERDRFILSKGHGAMCLYTILADRGFFPEADIESFGKLESPFGWHPNMHKNPGIDMSTGSLGHGLSVAVGAALAARLDRAPWRVYCMLGDGELDEGTVWEAAMSAAHFELGNLVAIVDRNGYCGDGSTEEVMALEPLADKWRAFGWETLEMDGHDMRKLLGFFDSLPPPDSDKPVCLVAETVKGKGVSFMEGKFEWHYGGLDDDKGAEALGDIEAARGEGR